MKKKVVLLFFVAVPLAVIAVQTAVDFRPEYLCVILRAGEMLSGVLIFVVVLADEMLGISDSDYALIVYGPGGVSKMLVANRICMALLCVFIVQGIVLFADGDLYLASFVYICVGCSWVLLNKHIARMERILGEKK